MDAPKEAPLRAGRAAPAALYAAMTVAAVAAFFAIRAAGRGLTAPPPAAAHAFGRATTGAGGDALLHVLLALLAIITASRAWAWLFRKVHQPEVIGEVVAGILLGPSLLGRVAPGAAAFLLPPSVAPALGVLAQVGVILFMFLVGMELDTTLVRRNAQATAAIAHASIAAPFVMGAAAALWLYPRYATADVPFGVFALFMGVSMSVTAFPVLARILTDRGLQRTPLGVIALSCAAVGDVTAWCMLALVVGVANARLGAAARTLALAALYGAVMLGAVRPLVARAARRQELLGAVPRSTTAALLVGLLASSLATEAIGVHALFGAFLLGAVVPHDSLLARAMREKLEDVAVVFLLPAFFAFTGLRTQIGLLQGAGDWLACAGVVAVACAGKFGGTALAARLSGLPPRDAASLGVLMNTRGLMELIVLNVGLDLGVLSPALFAMMVVMALATTVATSPALHALQRARRPEGVPPGADVV